MIKFRQNFLLALVVVGVEISNGMEVEFEAKGPNHINLSLKNIIHEKENSKINCEPIDYFFEMGDGIAEKATAWMSINYFIEPVSTVYYQIMEKGFYGIKGIAANGLCNGLYYLSYPVRINLDHLKGVDQ